MTKQEELSLCRSCGCMTWTVSKPALSASENPKRRYECGKCGFKKELECIARLKRKGVRDNA